MYVLGRCAGDNSTTAETTAETTAKTTVKSTTTTTEGKILTLMGWEKYDHCTALNITTINVTVAQKCKVSAKQLMDKHEHEKDEDKHEKHEGNSVG